MQRLDDVVSTHLGVSKSRAQALIKRGAVKWDGKVITKSGAKVRTGGPSIVKSNIGTSSGGTASHLNGVAALLSVDDEVRSAMTESVARTQTGISAPRAESIDLNVLYEDEHVAVVYKPAGMVTHPSVNNAEHTLVNALLARYGVGGLSTFNAMEDKRQGELNSTTDDEQNEEATRHDATAELRSTPATEADNVVDTFDTHASSTTSSAHRPGIVHRLDKDTSGLLIVCRENDAHRCMQAMFEDRKVEKTYVALVHGSEVRTLHVGDTFDIDAPIARHASGTTRMCVRSDGKASLTNVEVMAIWPKLHVALLYLHPITGRTHQLRVHLAHRGIPILGDTIYSKSHLNALRRHVKKNEVLGLQLCAFRVVFKHPKNVTLPLDETSLVPKSDAISLTHFLSQIERESEGKKEREEERDETKVEGIVSKREEESIIDVRLSAFPSHIRRLIDRLNEVEEVEK